MKKLLLVLLMVPSLAWGEYRYSGTLPLVQVGGTFPEACTNTSSHNLRVTYKNRRYIVRRSNGQVFTLKFQSNKFIGAMTPQFQISGDNLCKITAAMKTKGFGASRVALTYATRIQCTNDGVTVDDAQCGYAGYVRRR